MFQVVALIFARARRRRVRNGKCTRSSGVVGGDIEPQDRGTNMRTGTVVSYSVEKGWGFIRPDYGDGKDLFVHISDLRGCAGADLVSGTRVTFGVNQRTPSRSSTSDTPYIDPRGPGPAMIS